VSWNEYHSKSEILASDAEMACRSGDFQKAENLYRQAAAAEVAAFAALTSDKRRTRGVTAVSAVALWYKGHDYPAAERSAYLYLAEQDLPDFAKAQIQNLLQVIWTTSTAEKAGVRFVRGDVLVSVRGGEVILGGAPLDLILRKVEGVQAALFRTVEMLLERPFRKRGGPSSEIQSMFRPWLFQAPAGSYQFAVRMQEPAQGELWEAARPKVGQVTSTFFKVLRASATDPDTELPTIVPDPDYRGAFLTLSRNLAPTGKSFELLEVRDASAPTEPVITLGLQTRGELNSAIRKLRPPRELLDGEPITIRGTLRAVHLDDDWLEVTTAEDPPGHVHVEEAGDALDDVVGPMVNRKVLVTVVPRGTKRLYRDIELDE
jgi:hypothetical protein